MLEDQPKSKGDGCPVSDTGCGIGEQEQIANHEHRPFPAIGLAPGDRDGRKALRGEDEPGEEGERGGERPALCQPFAERGGPVSSSGASIA
jgi:hypothetical protein